MPRVAGGRSATGELRRLRLQRGTAELHVAAQARLALIAVPPTSLQLLCWLSELHKCFDKRISSARDPCLAGRGAKGREGVARGWSLLEARILLCALLELSVVPHPTWRDHLSAHQHATPAVVRPQSSSALFLFSALGSASTLLLLRRYRPPPSHRSIRQALPSDDGCRRFAACVQDDDARRLCRA